jgi:hypothetical protein
MYGYTAYGLTLRSELILPELIPAHAAPDVTITLGAVPETLAALTGRGVWYQVSPHEFLLNIPDTARYLAANGSTVTIERAPDAPDALVRLYLLGSVLAAILHQRGALPLHGSAINTPRGAVIFCGPSGRGKSTLAWEFQRRGYQHMCDDISVIGFDAHSKPLVYPAYPQLNLWTDVLEKHPPPRDVVRALHPELQKYALPTRAAFDAAPTPLFALYYLQTTNTDTLTLEPIKGLDKLQILVANTYRARWIAAMAKRTLHFQTAAHAGQSIRTRRVTRPLSPFRLHELADLIERDLAA